MKETRHDEYVNAKLDLMEKRIEEIKKNLAECKNQLDRIPKPLLFIFRFLFK